MIAEEQKLHFSYDEAQKLTSIEKKANEKLT
jgi:adenosine deaminase CECR1